MLSLYSPLGVSGFRVSHIFKVGFPDSSVAKESACNARDPSLIPGLGRSAGEGLGYALQYSYASLVAWLVSACNVGDVGSIPGLGRSLEKGMATHSSVLACIVHGVTRSRTPLSDFHFTFHNNEMVIVNLLV